MALYLSCLGFALVFHSLILCVPGSQQAILSVQAPVVYVVVGKSVSLNCIINGTSFLASRVSWKHEGQWLHNQTRPQGTKVPSVNQCVYQMEKQPPEISLLWHVIQSVDDYQSLPFTYNVLFCHKSSIRNKFCLRPPYGYNISRECTDLSSSAGSMVVECNVTSLFKRLFPNLFDAHKEMAGRPLITFTVNIGNVQSDSYGDHSPCSAWDIGNII
ncbi:hypothetical protein OS493_029744 [Desmophyllum pertusum]|uniref:Ig-like domain-containing protein n=1 Tax=Desmophyllum pertusum TaxID=174260 RepID=A0A9X0CXT4_9CNID|nr:hypothetical protein OS493_029744 [Desmophyllum pertusum]